MRLADGLIIDNERTFGVLKFSAFRRERFRQNADGTMSDEVVERVYDLKCKTQGCMIQVGIPAEIPLKEFPFNAEVVLVNPVAGTISTPTFGGNADIDWWVKADDIMLKDTKAAGVRVAADKSGNKEPGK